MLMVRAVVAGLVWVVVMAGLLLIPAARLSETGWRWPAALAFLAVYGGVSVLGTVMLAIFRPASFKVRMQGLVAKREQKQPLIDAVGTLAYVAYLAAWIVFIPFDVFRLHLLAAPSGWLRIVGGLAGLIGLAVGILAVAQNEFAAPTVQDQSSSGQRVVDHGLYGVIRHPLYAGNLLTFAGMALWLGSTAALVGTLGLVLFTAARIAVEEQELRRTLAGYDDYARRVRSRLIPFVI
jgi:protein-S-isoprenylcysteine O-methyltransferase Ste14